MTEEVVMQKMIRYCAYRERNHLEVRLKLAALQVYGHRQEQLVARLIEEGYLNELRYAKAFVTGKFRINYWGRNKISRELKMRHISDYSIRKALLEIDEDEYREVLIRLINKRKLVKPAETDFELRQYLQARGFEYEYLKDLLHD